MDFFSTQNILVHIPIGAGGYDLSWIEAVGTLAGLLCIWLASLEKIINYIYSDSIYTFPTDIDASLEKAKTAINKYSNTSHL